MFKNFNGNEVEKAQALLGIKVIKISVETGYFEGAFYHAMDNVNLDADKKEVVKKKLEQFKSIMLSFNNDDDFTEEFWEKVMNINKEIYEILGLTEEEYYTYSIEFASKHEELTMETVSKQMAIVE